MKDFIKRSIAAVSALAMTITLSSVANAGAVLDRIEASKTLTVAVGTDWGVMSHLNDKQEVDGYDLDVAKEIAKRLGVNPKFVTPGWDVIESGNWQGRWDMAMGQMTPLKARAERFDWPGIYFYETHVAVVHKDSTASKPADLEGKKIGTRAGTTLDMYANHTLKPEWVDAKPIEFQFTPGEIVSYPSANSISLEDLRLGDGVRLDGVLVELTMVDAALKNGYPLRVLSPALWNAPGVVSIEKGDKELFDKVAAAIQGMKDDGTLSKLSLKWYGADYTKPE